MPPLGLILLIGCYVVVFSLLILNIFVSRVSGKYFDQQFLKRYKPLPAVYGMFATKRTMRGINYLAFVLFDQNRFLNCPLWRKEKYEMAYARKWMPFNYRELARKRDWVIGILFFSLMAIFLLYLCIGSVCGVILYFSS